MGDKYEIGQTFDFPVGRIVIDWVTDDWIGYRVLRHANPDGVELCKRTPDNFAEALAFTRTQHPDAPDAR